MQNRTEKSLIAASSIAIVLALVAGLVSPAAAGVKATAEARQPVPEPVGSLAAGDTLFWDGELYVERTAGSNFPYGVFANDGPPDFETCNTAEPCWAYEIEVTEAADRLRVGMDNNDRSDCFWFELWAPGTYEGEDPEATYTALSEVSCHDYFYLFPMLWSLEAEVKDPQPGTWVVRVVPFAVDDWGFRMRASLENEHRTGPNALLPDLVSVPPYELGFNAPASPAAGASPDSWNPEGRVVSCTPDEIVEANRETGTAPLRCLRFSAGIYNIGDGLLDLRLWPDGNVVQMIRTGDGSLAKARQAGSWESGGTHLHKHYEGYADFSLYKVLDIPSHPAPNEEGYLERAGGGHKLGWGAADQRLYDWSRFDPWDQFDRFYQCRDVEKEECIILSPGWGDNYRSMRPGMYVDFPLDVAGSADGDYIVRMIIDRDDHVEESDERNNISYAWVRVLGDQVTVCERGQGGSPWDPQKDVHIPDFWVGTPGGTTADESFGTCS